jgi:ABC-type proline/glycine betaine transport system permease subunit
VHGSESVYDNCFCIQCCRFLPDPPWVRFLGLAIPMRGVAAVASVLFLLLFAIQDAIEKIQNAIKAIVDGVVETSQARGRRAFCRRPAPLDLGRADRSTRG